MDIRTERMPMTLLTATRPYTANAADLFVYSATTWRSQPYITLGP